MLAPRLFRLGSSSPVFPRFLSTSSVRYRAPSIRDITPDNAATFNARQKEFRENLEAARKQKERQESQSVDASVSSIPPSPARAPGSPPTAPDVSNAGGLPPVIDAAESLDVDALSSLSTHRIVGEDRQAEMSSQSTKRGAFSSLIYGTKEGQQLDKDIERSFSQVLARGKYVHSIVFHAVKPEKVDEYVELVGEWYPKMARMEDNRVNLVGSWRTQVGDNDTFGTDMTANETPLISHVKV
jgi:hypothetical protein